jgi:putative protease
MKMIELLAPAGDLEKLKIAIDYGADAVYFGGEMFGLRAAAKNFTLEEIREGVQYAHDRGRKIHMTINIFAHNEDIGALEDYLQQLKEIPIDAFIVSDPGIIMMIREAIPDAEIHLSTQANMTNYKTAEFWHKLGVKRIVLARELTFDEIREQARELKAACEEVAAGQTANDIVRKPFFLHQEGGQQREMIHVTGKSHLLYDANRL